jgi:hypothetical protein
MGILILRSSATAGGGGGSWADTIVDFSNFAPELATAGRIVGLNLDNNDYGARADTTNNASVTRIAGGSWDGTAAIRLRPPTGSINNADATYCGIANGIDLSNSGTQSIFRARAGWTMYCGAQWHLLGANSKVTGFLGATTVNGATSANARTAIFDQQWEPGNVTHKVYAVTAATVQSYHQPVSGTAPDGGPDTDKLLQQAATINHAANPPQTGQEWLYWEEYIDYRQDLGNALGLHRVDVWARDGHLGYLEIPLNHNSSWDYSYQYIRTFEYLGGLFNDPSTAHADNFCDVSHFRMMANTATQMGPPSGFLL